MKKYFETERHARIEKIHEIATALGCKCLSPSEKKILDDKKESLWDEIHALDKEERVEDILEMCRECREEDKPHGKKKRKE